MGRPVAGVGRPWPTWPRPRTATGVLLDDSLARTYVVGLGRERLELAMSQMMTTALTVVTAV